MKTSIFQKSLHVSAVEMHIYPASSFGIDFILKAQTFQLFQCLMIMIYYIYCIILPQKFVDYQVSAQITFDHIYTGTFVHKAIRQFQNIEAEVSEVSHNSRSVFCLNSQQVFVLKNQHAMESVDRSFQNCSLNGYMYELSDYYNYQKPLCLFLMANMQFQYHIHAHVLMPLKNHSLIYILLVDQLAFRSGTSWKMTISLSFLYLI